MCGRWRELWYVVVAIGLVESLPSPTMRSQSSSSALQLTLILNPILASSSHFSFDDISDCDDDMSNTFGFDSKASGNAFDFSNDASAGGSFDFGEDAHHAADWSSGAPAPPSTMRRKHTPQFTFDDMDTMDTRPPRIPRAEPGLQESDAVLVASEN